MKFSPDTAGKRIRELREKKGITQKELAAARKMTQSAIAKQESGATAIGEEGLCWYADYFGVSADYLLGRTDVPQTASRGLADLPGGAEGEPPAPLGVAGGIRSAHRRAGLSRAAVRRRFVSRRPKNGFLRETDNGFFSVSLHKRRILITQNLYDREAPVGGAF